MIKQALCAATMLATLSTSVSAAAAGVRDAAFATSADSTRNQPSMFSGATVRLNLDGRSETKPQIALRVAGASRSEAGLKIGEGLALAASGEGKAKLTIAGQDSKIVGQRLGVGGKSTLWIVGGLVVVAVVVIALNSGDGLFGDDDDECGSFVNC